MFLRYCLERALVRLDLGLAHPLAITFRIRGYLYEMSHAIKRQTSEMEDPEDRQIIEQQRSNRSKVQFGVSKPPSLQISDIMYSNPRKLGPIDSWLEGVSPTPRRRRHSDSALISMGSKGSGNMDRSLITERSLDNQENGFGLAVPSDGSSTRQTLSTNQPTNNLLASPNYQRHNLTFNGIYIDYYGFDMPVSVRTYTEDVLHRNPKSEPSPLSDDHAVQIRLKISMLVEPEEATFNIEIISLLPTGKNIVLPNGKMALLVGADLPWDRLGLPLTPAGVACPVTTPKSDRHFGYPVYCFRPSSILVDPSIYHYANPTSGNNWPFFMMEFKSRSYCGSGWVAENQNSSSGSHSVNCIEKLLGYVRPAQDRKTIESVALSCVLDNYSATIWVHWLELKGDSVESGDEPRFVSSELDTCLFKRLDDIVRLFTHMQNILEWGAGERLDMIKGALATIQNNPSLLKMGLSDVTGAGEITVADDED